MCVLRTCVVAYYIVCQCTRVDICQGVSFGGLHRLHLPSLTWRADPQCHGDASTRTIAGHCLVAGLEFGGCMATILGVLPISKLDLMLLMPGAVGAVAPTARGDVHTGTDVGAAGRAAEAPGVEAEPPVPQGPRQVWRADGKTYGVCTHVITV